MAQGETNAPRQVLWKVTADQVCQLFEQSLRRGPRLMPESLLEYVPESDRTPLLFGLLQREIHFREQAGETLSREEFERRFPNHDLLRDALINDDVHLKRVDEALPDDDVLERIGRSPIGAVYKVRQRSSGNMMCVRSLPRLFIEQEQPSGCSITDLAFMLHPNLARPLALVESEGDMLLLTEFVEGPTLAGLVAQRHPIPLGVVCEFMRQAASGIIQVHDHFRCHGDLRPQSLILDAARGMVKVSGLGLTEQLNLRFLRYATAPTDGGMRFLGFRAPELGHEPPQLDKRSDVYSLGCTLYYALTGEVPPEQPNPAKSDDESSFPVRCPRKLEAIIWQMLAIDPEERLDDAAMVHEVLSEFADPSAFKTWCAEVASGVAPTQTTVTETSTLDTHTATASETWPRHFSTPVPVPVRAPAPVAPQPQAASVPALELPTRRSGWRPSRTLVASSVAILLGVAGTIGFLSLPGTVPPPQARPLWASSLAEQPDVYGDWWFDEFPWYAPVVRKKILTDAAIADADEIALAEELATAPNEKQMDALRTMVAKMVRQAPPHDLEWQVVGSLLKIDPAQESTESLNKSFEHMQAKLDPEKANTPTAQHMRALLHHKLGDDAAARVAYESAVDGYHEQGLTELEAVCFGDLGRTFEPGLSLEAISQYEQAVDKAVSPALKSALSVRIAFNYRKRNRMNKASEALDDAERFANSSELKFNDNHMLREVCYEERGWVEFDRWRLERAQEWLGKANEVLKDQTDANDVKLFTKRLMITQNDAMVNHFAGKSKAAQDGYNGAISKIAGRLDFNLKSQDRRNLERRFPNLYERLGDTYLFGTPSDYPKAAANYSKAAREAHSPSFELDQLWPHVANIEFKRVVSLCLDFQHKQAKSEYDKTDASIAQRGSVTSGQEQIYGTSRALATAMLAVNQQDHEETVKALAKLDEFCAQQLKIYDARGNVSRYDLDAMLLSTQFLLRPDQTSPFLSDSVVQKLEYLIKNVYENGEVSEDYLYPYARSGDVALRNSTSLGGRKSVITDIASRGLVPILPNDVGTSPAKQGGVKKLSRLYALTVGVSHYADSSKNLGVADQDAIGLAQDFQGLCEGDDALFELGTIKSLTDEEATAKNISEWINKFRNGSSSDGILPVREGDVVFFTFSGHGKGAHGGRSYYLLPHEYDDKLPPEVTGIQDDELFNTLDSMPATVVCVLDSCYSGAAFAPSKLHDGNDRFAMSDNGVNRGEEQENTYDGFQQFPTANGSHVVAFASSLSSQPSQESRIAGHGYLTLALREVLQGHHLNQLKSNTPLPGHSRSIVTLEDVEFYILPRVREISLGNQKAKRITQLGGNASLSDLPIRVSK